jgi:hypothetical protein
LVYSTPLPQPLNPALLKHSEDRAQDVQTEDQQNQQLLDLSKQILRLTRELRSYANTVQAEDKQNRELIDLSRQTLTLTKQVDARLASDGRPDSDSSGAVGGRIARRR